MLILLVCCSKEDDGEFPAITIISPDVGDFFELGVDSVVFVEALITDNRKLNTVELSLVNQQYARVMPPARFTPASKVFSLRYNYQLVSTDIETGDYYIAIRAEDGTNIKRTYQAIEIKGIPDELKEMIVLSGSTDEITVARYNPELIPVDSFQFLSDFTDSEVGASGDILFIAGYQQSNLTAFDVASGMELWGLAPMINPPNHSGSCLHWEDDLYVSFYNEYIRSYDVNGGVTSTSAIKQGEHAGNLITVGNQILAEIAEPAAGRDYLVTFYYESCVRKQTIPVQFTVTGFFPIGGQEVLVLGNSKMTNKGIIKRFNISDGILTSCLDLEEEIVAASNYTKEKYFISTDIGLYLFDLDHPSYISVLVEGQYNVLCYEILNKRLFAGRGNVIDVLDVSDMNIVQTLGLTYPVLAIHPRYSGN